MAIELVLEEVTNEEVPPVAMEMLRKVSCVLPLLIRVIFCCCWHRNRTKQPDRLQCVISVSV